MKLSSAKLVGVNVVITLLGMFLVNATVSYAEDKKDYSQEAEDKKDHGQEQIKKLMEDEIIPLAERLSPLLRKVLPKKDGKSYPIVLVYAPSDSEEPQRATYHCPWGATDCEQFLKACAALQESCSCSDSGSIDPDPC